MKQIPLSQGLFALVDDEDFEELSRFKWCAARKEHNSYAARTVWDGNKTKRIYMHRQILGLSGRYEYCDHINGDGTDNRRENLRLCSNAENGINRGKNKNNTSGFKGVTRDKGRGKWIAQIMVGRKNKIIGRYDDVKDAAEAYRLESIKMHKEFAHSSLFTPKT